MRNEAISVAQNVEGALQVLVGFNLGPIQAGRNEFRVLNPPRAVRVNVFENSVDEIGVCIIFQLLTAILHECPELFFVDRSAFVGINQLKEFPEVG